MPASASEPISNVQNVTGIGFRKPAHVAHVVGVDRVDHRARAQEQQRLEERVREQVEERRRCSPLGPSDSPATM